MTKADSVRLSAKSGNPVFQSISATTEGAVLSAANGCLGLMIERALNANQKGAIGEAIFFAGRKPPSPVVETIRSFIKNEYDVAESSPIVIYRQRNAHYRVISPDGEAITTRPDGIIEAEWVRPEFEDNIETSRHGFAQPLSRQDVDSEKAMFPAEVKTGEYAELERNQKEVLGAVSSADERTHPVVVQISLDNLPDEFEIQTRFL